MISDFRVQIASVSDRAKLVAEIYYKGEYLGELNQDGPCLAIEIYPNPSGEPWRLELAELMKVLDDAGKDLRT
ncbi:MAG: hypothetical protein ABI700_13625 [Chloroflexota bacterium]